jgi:hypothetical protein
MGNPTNSNNKGGQPPKAPATTPVANNSPFVIGGSAPGSTQTNAAAGPANGQPAWGNYTMPGQPIGSGITKPTYNPGPGKDTLSTLLPGGVPAGVDRFGNNNTPVIANKTFIGTGNMPGQGYYVDSNSPEAMAQNQRQSTQRSASAASPFSITGQQTLTQAPSTGTAYSGPLRQQPAAQSVTGTPGNAGLADILAQVQASKGTRPPVGPAPSVYQPQPYKPYVPYDDSTAWGGSPSSVYGGSRTPLAEALARRNQTPEAPYYG